MAISTGDPNLLASIVASDNVVSGSGVGDLLVSGSSLPFSFWAGPATGPSNNGGSFSGNPVVKREVRPGSSGMFGSCVQVTGKGATFRGTVIAELQIELGTTGGTGSLTECVMVQNAGLRFLAQVSSVEKVPF